jgi:hypothetical protein
VTFSNSCGSETVSQGRLQNGAIPNTIIPCPRPQTSTRPRQTAVDIYEKAVKNVRRDMDEMIQASCRSQIKNLRDYLNGNKEEWELSQSPTDLGSCHEDPNSMMISQQLENAICIKVSRTLIGSKESVSNGDITLIVHSCQYANIDEAKIFFALRDLLDKYGKEKCAYGASADIKNGAIKCPNTDEPNSSSSWKQRCEEIEQDKQNEAVSCWGGLAESTEARDDQGLVNYAKARASELGRNGPQGEAAQKTQRIAPGCSADFPIRRTGPACVGVPGALSVGSITACCVVVRSLREQLRER